MVYFMCVCLMICLMDFNTCNPEFTGILILFYFLLFVVFFKMYYFKFIITPNKKLL